MKIAFLRGGGYDSEKLLLFLFFFCFHFFGKKEKTNSKYCSDCEIVHGAIFRRSLFEV